MTDHTPSPATDEQVYCCVACRAEGWACPALCQRPCCGAEIAATQDETCACGHARFMHGDTTGDTGCRGCRCESWRPVQPSPLDDLCCNGEGCSRCATPSPATDEQKLVLRVPTDRRLPNEHDLNVGVDHIDVIVTVDPSIDKRGEHQSAYGADVIRLREWDEQVLLHELLHVATSRSKWWHDPQRQVSDPNGHDVISRIEVALWETGWRRIAPTPSPAPDGLREAIEALRAEMVGLAAAGASLVGRGWIIHRCDQILAAHPAPPVSSDESVRRYLDRVESVTTSENVLSVIREIRDELPVSSDENRADEGDDDGPECETCGKTTCPDADLAEFSEPVNCAYKPVFDALRDAKDCDYGCARDLTNQGVRLYVVPAVERILAARLAEVEQERDAFKRQYNAGFREWQQAHTEAAREKARADALVSEIEALIDRTESSLSARYVHPSYLQAALDRARELDGAS